MVDKEARSSDNWRMLDLSYGTVFQNLAMEEALARNTTSAAFRPTVRFWVNPPAVVLGRFQEASAEVDTMLCEQNRIQIARRFTGGGAVFHDEGNLNFTIVTRLAENVAPADLHETESSIILAALSGLGLEATFLPPNSVLIGQKKVAGAAAALGNGFALWHSSILVSTNVNTLELVLAPSKKSNMNRYVHSRWHPVTTLQTALGHSISIDEVKSQLVVSTEETLGAELEAGRLHAEEERFFTNLYNQKYSSTDWNRYGNLKESEMAP